MASCEGKNEEERKAKKSGSLRLRKPKDRPKLMDLQPAPPTTSASEGAVEVPQPGRGRADSAATTTTTTTPPAGEEGTATDSPATKKRHQRSRSVGKGGLMNLIGLKKKTTQKDRQGTGATTQADGCGRHGNHAAPLGDAEEGEQSKKTVSAVVTSTADKSAQGPRADDDVDGEGDDQSAPETDSSSAADEQPRPTAADTEEDDADSSQSAVASSSVSWHSSSGAIRRKLPRSSSSLQEQAEADDPRPSSAEDAPPARLAASRPVSDYRASSSKQINRRNLSGQVKLFPPLPSTPDPATTKQAEAGSPAPTVSVLARAADAPAPAGPPVPALRSHLSAVSVMHQTRLSARKRMTMDPGALKALYAQDPAFQRRLSSTTTSVSSQVQAPVVEGPEVLLALQTLAEQGIEEDDIWNGKPEVFPLLEPFKNELKKAVGVGCKSSAVNFLLPDISFFGGLKAKTFKVNNLQPIAHLLHAITAKLGGKSMTLRRSSFALSTLAGHHSTLANYGLGSILQMWELKIVVLKRGISGVHAAVDKKPLPNPQQLIFEQVKGLQSQTADLGQRVGHAEAEQRQIEARMEELAREIEKNDREREEARAGDEAESQQRLRREWRLDVEGGIERLRGELAQRAEQREARLLSEAKELRDALEQERGQAREKEDRLTSALTALAGEVEAMRAREAQERQRVERLVAVLREEMEERERERTQREQALREEIERAQALMKGGDEAKQAQSELDVAKVVAGLQAENDRQRKELVRRVHDDWEREKQALVAHLRAEWERETRATVQRLREDWELERAKEHEALARRAREEREEKQRELAERERREERSLMQQESGKALREVLETVAKLQSHLEASEKKVERQAKALEILDKRVKAAAVAPPSASSSSAVTPPPPPPPTVVTPAAALSIIAKPAASKRPALKREDQSCANLLLAGLQKRFSAIQQSQAEELEEADDASWQYTP